MGQKVDPRSFRIGITRTWQSRWFGAKKDFAKNLASDVQIREYVARQWKDAAISRVDIERAPGVVRIIISTGRPGVLIGRGGTGIDDMIAKIKKAFFAGKPTQVKVDVREIRHVEEDAALVAQQVAQNLEKRMPFRRTLKTTLESVKRNRDVKGVKIEVAGRLDGAEMSRREWMSDGRIPLQTLRADIDFAKDTARTTYGAIGIKVWIYKGEKFDTEPRAHQ